MISVTILPSIECNKNLCNASFLIMYVTIIDDNNANYIINTSNISFLHIDIILSS